MREYNEIEEAFADYEAEMAQDDDQANRTDAQWEEYELDYRVRAIEEAAWRNEDRLSGDYAT